MIYCICRRCVVFASQISGIYDFIFYFIEKCTARPVEEEEFSNRKRDERVKEIILQRKRYKEKEKQ